MPRPAAGDLGGRLYLGLRADFDLFGSDSLPNLREIVRLPCVRGRRETVSSWRTSRCNLGG